MKKVNFNLSRISAIEDDADNDPLIPSGTVTNKSAKPNFKGEGRNFNDNRGKFNRAPSTSTVSNEWGELLKSVHASI